MPLLTITTQTACIFKVQLVVFFILSTPLLFEKIDHKRLKGTCFSVLATIQHILFRGNSAATHL